MVQFAFIVHQMTFRIPFLSDEAAASSTYNLLTFVAAAFWVPLYREFHFYFAHRSHSASKREKILNLVTSDSSISPPCTSTSTASITGTPTLNPFLAFACIPWNTFTTSAVSGHPSWSTQHLLLSCKAQGV